MIPANNPLASFISVTCFIVHASDLFDDGLFDLIGLPALHVPRGIAS
jgi:hypothetical protein